MQFRDDGWFNATAAAAKFNKEPSSWLRLVETAGYVCALADILYPDPVRRTQLNEIKELHAGNMNSASARTQLAAFISSTGLVVGKRGGRDKGGGTWLHPKLAVAFARWLSDDFAAWCDIQIDNIIHGEEKDWRMLRHSSAAGYKVMSEMLYDSRVEAGKSVESRHYATEAKLVNWALTGAFKPLDREQLSTKELDLLARLQRKNTRLLAQNISYQQRKEALHDVAEAEKTKLLSLVS
jgi:hypothetical protein